MIQQIPQTHSLQHPVPLISKSQFNPPPLISKPYTPHYLLGSFPGVDLTEFSTQSVNIQIEKDQNPTLRIVLSVCSSLPDAGPPKQTSAEK